MSIDDDTRDIAQRLTDALHVVEGIAKEARDYVAAHDRPDHDHGAAMLKQISLAADFALTVIARALGRPIPPEPHLKSVP